MAHPRATSDIDPVLTRPRPGPDLARQQVAVRAQQDTPTVLTARRAEEFLLDPALNRSSAGPPAVAAVPRPSTKAPSSCGEQKRRAGSRG